MNSRCIVRLVETGGEEVVGSIWMTEWRKQETSLRCKSPCGVCGADHLGALATLSDAQSLLRFHCPAKVEHVWIPLSSGGSMTSFLAVEIGHDEPETQESRRAQIVRSILPYIDSHYSRALTLTDCAKKAGLNAVYFSGLFARVMGTPFKTYLTALRLKRAEHLLMDPILRVSEVAHAVGYADPNRFRQAFKASRGLSPSQWRTKNKRRTI